MFVQQRIQDNNNENINVRHCWPFVRGIHRWPMDSPIKGQWQLFHTMTSSWNSFLPLWCFGLPGVLVQLQANRHRLDVQFDHCYPRYKPSETRQGRFRCLLWLLVEDGFLSLAERGLSQWANFMCKVFWSSVADTLQYNTILHTSKVKQRSGRNLLGMNPYTVYHKKYAHGFCFVVLCL